MNAKICFSSNIWSLSQISRESDYSIYSTLNLQETICIALPLSNFVRIGKNGPNSNQYSPSFLHVPKYY